MNNPSMSLTISGMTPRSGSPRGPGTGLRIAGVVVVMPKRFVLLSQGQADVVCHSSLESRDILVDGGVQEARLPVDTFNDHRG